MLTSDMLLRQCMSDTKRQIKWQQTTQKTSVEIVTATKLRANIKNNIKYKKQQVLKFRPGTYVQPPTRGPIIKDLYRHKNTKSSAFPSTIYHIVRPLVREGHSL